MFVSCSYPDVIVFILLYYHEYQFVILCNIVLPNYVVPGKLIMRVLYYMHYVVDQMIENIFLLHLISTITGTILYFVL